MNRNDRINLSAVQEALRLCEKYLNIPISDFIACGDYGCVFTTGDASKILKVGMHWNEYHIAKYLLDNKNTLHSKFPKIYGVWNLDSCYSKDPFYAILRENLEDITSIDRDWFDVATSRLESQGEKVLDQLVPEAKIRDIALKILESNSNRINENLEFEKFVDFYIECLHNKILITDLATNFGQRTDGTIVLRDLGGVYLLK